MAQQLKQEVRDRIREAALCVFADKGYLKSRMSDIARQAGISTGNLYHYCNGKDDLFYAVIDEQFARSFLRLMKDRVRALSEPGENDMAQSHNAQQVAEDMLNFWVTHRRQVIIILQHAEGSSYENFSRQVVRELVKLAHQHYGLTEKLCREEQLVLRLVFENTLRVIVEILQRCADEADVRAAFRSFWRYQLAGLDGLLKS